jgi:hypothetical protein
MDRWSLLNFLELFIDQLVTIAVAGNFMTLASISYQRRTFSATHPKMKKVALVCTFPEPQNFFCFE